MTEPKKRSGPFNFIMIFLIVMVSQTHAYKPRVNSLFFLLKRPYTPKIKSFKGKIHSGPYKKQLIWLKSYNLHFYSIYNISSSSSTNILYMFQV